MSFNYRFSVIPAGAIIDARLTPRALQVLCLLGRHTNDAGWCSRSQVKMARELDCGRSTIYDALEVLCGAGWVERKRNGRGSTSPESTEQPFAAYSYRVILDRDDIPARLRDDEIEASELNQSPLAPSDEGAGIAAGGAAQAAGGAAMAAPLEGKLSKGISTEPEREHARARDKQARGLADFEARWPTAAADDRGKVAFAWGELSEDEREAALSNIGRFLDNLKKHKRSHPPTGWRYLQQKPWALLEAKSASPPTPRIVEGSPEGRALIVLCELARSPKPYRLSDGSLLWSGPITPQILAFADAPPRDAWKFIDADLEVQRTGAWRELLTTIFAGKSRTELVQPHHGPDGSRRGFYSPYPWPPRKDGSISTGPPSDNLSTADIDELTKS